LVEEYFSSINNDFGILSKICSVTYKLGSEQAIDNHPKNKSHAVVLYDLMCSIRHLKPICTVDVGILSHQLCLAMNGSNAEIILGRDDYKFPTKESNPYHLS
jgi:hypothetical protein